MFRNRSYVADSSIPGLAEIEVTRLATHEPEGRYRLRGLTRRQLRDLGLDRSAAG